MMIDPLHIYRLRAADDPLFAECWALYESAFPAEERRTLACQRLTMAEQGQGNVAAYHCLRLEQGGCFAGLAFCWEASAFIYVEHLAITPGRRGQGLGHLALEHICHRWQGRPLILEIEPVVNEATERRWRFYRSAGFHLLPYPHWQPCYRRGDAPLALTLLSYPHALSAGEAARYEAFMQQTVALFLPGEMVPASCDRQPLAQEAEKDTP